MKTLSKILELISLHWIKFTPLAIFLLFIGLLSTAETMLGESGSTVDLKKHILSSDSFTRSNPVKRTSDGKWELTSANYKKDKDGNYIKDKDGNYARCEDTNSNKSANANTNVATNISANTAANSDPASSTNSSTAPLTASQNQCAPTVLPAQSLLSERFSRQTIWMFFMALNVFFGLIGLVIYVVVANKYVSLGFWLTAILICATSAYVLAYCKPSTVVEPIIKETVEKQVKEGDKTYPATAGGFEEDTVLSLIKKVNFIADFAAIATPLAMIAVLFGVVGRKISLWPENDEKPENLQPPTADPNEIKKRQELLLTLVSDLRVVLYVATVLLIVGMLRLSSVLSWSATFMNSEAAVPANLYFANFTFVVGASYTAFLAAIYLPSYFYLKNEADKLDLPANDGVSASSFKAEFFEFSLSTSLPHIIAIAAPFMTGTVKELITNIFGGV